MKEKKEMEKLLTKIGFDGTVISATLLLITLFQEERSLIQIGALSTCFITSNMVLVRKKMAKVQTHLQKFIKIKKLG